MSKKRRHAPEWFSARILTALRRRGAVVPVSARVKLSGALAVAAAVSVAGCSPVHGDRTQSPQAPSSSPSATTDPHRAGLGRLVVEAGNLDYFSYGPRFEVWSESREPEVVVPKGDYVVVVYLTDATSYVANVTVEGNMKTTSVTPVSDPRPYEKVVADMGELDRILPLGGGRHLIYGPDHEPRVQLGRGDEPVAQLPLDRVDLACYLDSHRVVMLGDKTKAFLFDTKTGDFTPFRPEGVELGTLSFEFGRCADGVVRLLSDTQITRVGLSSVDAVAIPAVGTIAVGNLEPAVDTAGNTVAAVTTKEIPGDPGAPEIEEIVAATLVLIDRATGGRREVDLGQQSNDFYLSVSPDGSRVAVRYGYFINVYDTATADLLYTAPCGSDGIHWQSNDAFVYDGDVAPSRLYVADVSKREARGITRESSDVGVSATTAVLDGYLYFMGFSNDPDEPAHGYRIAVP